MATLTVLHKGIANGQEANWIPTIPANVGLSIQNNDGDYAASGNDGLGNPKNPLGWFIDCVTTSPAWIDDGTLSAPGVTITSVTVHIIHGNFDASNDLDVWFGISTGGGAFGATHGYATPADLGGYSVLLAGGGGGPYVEYISAPLATNPKTGVAWTADDLFLAPNLGGLQAFYFDKFRDGGAYPNYSNYRVNQIYLVVDYTTGPPTEVDVTGAGGVVVGGAGSTTGGGGVLASGAARTFGIGAGAPPELHLNQWGIEGFTLYPREEESL